MKHLLLILFLLALRPSDAVAQNIAYGDRVPKINKGIDWLNEQPPVASKYIFIQFCSTKNPASMDAIAVLHNIEQHTQGRLAVVIIGRESQHTLLPYVEELLSPHFTAIADPERKIFSEFNVNFVPFGILVDAKRKAVWMGNLMREHESLIELIQ